MKTAFIIIAFLFPLISFSQGNWKTLLKVKDTSLVCEFRIYHEESTGSLDAAIDTGTVRLRHYWFQFEKNHRYGSNLLFNTEKTFSKLFGKNYKSKKRFNVYLVRGKIIGIVPPNKGMHFEGYVFEVYQYKFLKRESLEESPLLSSNPE